MSKISKLTLIVDGNWLLMSRLSVLINRYKDLSELCTELKLLMVKSIKVVLRTFPDIDNIIFVSDGGSWRKHIDISNIEAILRKMIDGDLVGYKETRVYDTDEINWDVVFEEFNSFMKAFNDIGITVSREHYVEGDDWCWYWSKLLNNRGTNVIIWTKDNDLKQLVNTDINGCFTVWWNKENGLFKKETDESEMNWFFNNEYSTNETILNNLMKKSVKTTEINPYITVVEKIFMGDASDNVIPLCMRHAKNPSSDKKFRISKKDLILDIDITDESAIQSYIQSLFDSKSYHDRLINNDIHSEMEHFEFNRKMVWLDESVYPKEILDLMYKHDINNISCDMERIEETLQSQQNNIGDLLETI